MSYELFRVNEHESCRHYAHGLQAHFEYMEFPPGVHISEGKTIDNVLLFILEGEVTVQCDELGVLSVKEGEFFFIPIGTNYRGWSADKSALRLAVSRFIHVVNLCDGQTLRSLNKNKKEVFRFSSFSIRKTLEIFWEQLIVYLKIDTFCLHMQAIKLEELFWLLKVNYTKDELAELFYHIIGESCDFRMKVYACQKKAGTAEELARLCGYSKQQFAKKMREEFKTSPYKWMQERMRLLLKTKIADERISFIQIVDDLHLSSPQHLNRLCKKFFGKTPLELRRSFISDI